MQIQRFVQDTMPIVAPIVKSSAKWGAAGFVAFALLEHLNNNDQYAVSVHSGLLCGMAAFYMRGTVSVLYPSFGRTGATIGALASCAYSVWKNEDASRDDLNLKQRWKATPFLNLPFLASWALIAFKHRNLLQTYFQK